jgi:hypothetical protein
VSVSVSGRGFLGLRDGGGCQNRVTANAVIRVFIVFSFGNYAAGCPSSWVCCTMAARVDCSEMNVSRRAPQADVAQLERLEDGVSGAAAAALRQFFVPALGVDNSIPPIGRVRIMSVPGWEIGVGIEPDGGAGNGAADDPCLGTGAAPDVGAGVATVGVAPFARLTSGEAADDPTPKGLSPTGIGKPTTVLVAVSITDTVLSVEFVM